MKKILFVFFVLSFLFLGFSCKNNSDKDAKTIITERIQYPVFIKSPYPEETDWWVENLEGVKREKFVNLLLDAAFEGKVKVYDYLDNTLLSKAQVENIACKTDTIKVLRANPPYDEVDTVIVQKLDRKDIHRVTFMEEWNFDENNFTMEKKVVGIAPAETVYGDSAVVKGYKPLFWIYLDKNYPLKN
jgi:hypothetical protein